MHRTPRARARCPQSPAAASSRPPNPPGGARRRHRYTVNLPAKIHPVKELQLQPGAMLVIPKSGGIDFAGKADCNAVLASTLTTVTETTTSTTTLSPTIAPTTKPTAAPTLAPTAKPTSVPTLEPTPMPSKPGDTSPPSAAPTTSKPTAAPTAATAAGSGGSDAGGASGPVDDATIASSETKETSAIDAAELAQKKQELCVSALSADECKQAMRDLQLAVVAKEQASVEVATLKMQQAVSTVAACTSSCEELQGIAKTAKLTKLQKDVDVAKAKYDACAKNPLRDFSKSFCIVEDGVVQTAKAALALEKGETPTTAPTETPTAAEGDKDDGGGDGGGGGGSMGIIIGVVVAVVLLALVAIVVLKKSASEDGPKGAAGGSGRTFANPVYEEPKAADEIGAFAPPVYPGGGAGPPKKKKKKKQKPAAGAEEVDAGYLQVDPEADNSDEEPTGFE